MSYLIQHTPVNVDLATVDDDSVFQNQVNGDLNSVFENQGLTDDADSCCLAQTPGGAGNLTINGTDTSGGVWTAPVAPSTITITTLADETGVSATITGFSDIAGTVADSEVIALPASATTVNSTKKFGKITQIAVDGATSADITVGHLKRDFLLNGTDVDGGVWTSPTGAAVTISITSAADESSRDATISGYSDIAQTSSLQEAVSLANAGQVVSTNAFAVITGVAYDGQTTGNVQMGYVSDNFTLNGADVTSGVWTSPDGFAHQLAVTSAGDDTGTTLTITGYYDVEQEYPATITIAMSNTAVESTEYLAVITEVSADFTANGNVKLGFVDEAVAIVRLDPRSDSGTVNLTLTGTAGFDLQGTTDEINKRNAQHPFSVTNSIGELNWVGLASLTSLSASTLASLTTPLTAVRLKVNSYSAGAAILVSPVQLADD